MNTAEADEEVDDPGALAAVGCLRAISTILESVSRLPQLFVQIEPTLLPIMRRMLTSDGQGVHYALIFGFFLSWFFLSFSSLWNSLSPAIFLFCLTSLSGSCRRCCQLFSIVSRSIMY